MNWWRRLAQNRLIDFGVAAIALLQIVRIAQMVPGRAQTWDFNVFYVSSRLLLNEDNPYTTSLGSLSAHYGFPFDAQYMPIAPYPPGCLWFFAPLAMLTPRAAFVAWVGVEAASLAAILCLVRHLLRGRLSNRGWMFVSLAVLASGAVYWHFFMSQLELPLAAIVLAAYALNRAGKGTAGCLALAVAGLMKLYPFVMLPWFVWRSADDNLGRWKNAVIVASFITLAILITGLQSWMDYFVHGLPVVIGCKINQTYNFSVVMLITNLGYAAHGFTPSPATAQLLWASGTVAGLAIIGSAYGWCFRFAGDHEAEWCLVATAMLLGIVNTVGHYFVFLIFPVAAMAARLARGPTLLRAVFFGLLVLALNNVGTSSTQFLDRHLYLKILANDVPLLGLIGLAGFFGRELWAARQPAIERGPGLVSD